MNRRGFLCGLLACAALPTRAEAKRIPGYRRLRPDEIRVLARCFTPQEIVLRDSSGSPGERRTKCRMSPNDPASAAPMPARAERASSHPSPKGAEPSRLMAERPGETNRTLSPIQGASPRHSRLRPPAGASMRASPIQSAHQPSLLPGGATIHASPRRFAPRPGRPFHTNRRIS